MPERNHDAPPSPEERLRAAYESAESTTAKAFEQAVGTPSFGAILARSAENVAALSRIRTEMADLVLRNLRVAGRSDITRLAKQLHRTEDKLERVLQEVEALRDELAARDASDAGAGADGADSGNARRGNGRGAGARGGEGSGANGRATASRRRSASGSRSASR